ncbi:Endo/exonuclease/phosphatase domain-containing protein [Aphelenchoides fujianensis]|nr:Endo/exonuclease/phosphatase domain-containing protein [Aphelenchoides fujianensis]
MAKFKPKTPKKKNTPLVAPTPLRKAKSKRFSIASAGLAIRKGLKKLVKPKVGPLTGVEILPHGSDLVVRKRATPAKSGGLKATSAADPKSPKARKSPADELKSYRTELTRALTNVTKSLDLSELPDGEDEANGADCIRLPSRVFNKYSVQLRLNKAKQMERVVQKAVKIKQELDDDSVIILEETLDADVVVIEADAARMEANDKAEGTTAKTPPPPLAVDNQQAGPSGMNALAAALNPTPSFTPEQQELQVDRSNQMRSIMGLPPHQSAARPPFGQPPAFFPPRPTVPFGSLFSGQRANAAVMSAAAGYGAPGGEVRFQAARTQTTSNGTTVTKTTERTQIAVKLPSKWEPRPLRRSMYTLGQELPPGEDPDAYVRICSYNILCETTRQTCEHLYETEEQQTYGVWEHRFPLLVKELQELQADIFGLQEVQADHVPAFDLIFKEHEYTTHYLQRTGDRVDGCLVAFRRQRFEQLDYVEIRYRQGSSQYDNDNVGQLLVLKDRVTDAVFCLTNTHILFNMKRGDQKLAQLVLLSAHVEQATRKWRDAPQFKGVLMIGDFNMEPRSPLYNFVRYGTLRWIGCKRQRLAFQDQRPFSRVEAFRMDFAVDPETCKFVDEPSNETVHTFRRELFRFRTAYMHYKNRQQTVPEISTFHQTADSPDFIFYSAVPTAKGMVEGGIQLRRRLSLPSRQDLEQSCGRLPNRFCGSDHLPIMADFAFV